MYSKMPAHLCSYQLTFKSGKVVLRFWIQFQDPITFVKSSFRQSNSSCPLSEILNTWMRMIVQETSYIGIYYILYILLIEYEPHIEFVICIRIIIFHSLCCMCGICSRTILGYSDIYFFNYTYFCIFLYISV